MAKSTTTPAKSTTTPVEASDKEQYPKFLWHKKEGERVVMDADEHESLGPGWQEEPHVESKGE